MICNLIEEAYDFWKVKGGPGSGENAGKTAELNGKFFKQFIDSGMGLDGLKAVGQTMKNTPYVHHAAGLGAAAGAGLGGAAGLGFGVLGSVFGDGDILGDMGDGIVDGGLLGAGAGATFGAATSPHTTMNLGKTAAKTAASELFKQFKEKFK